MVPKGSPRMYVDGSLVGGNSVTFCGYELNPQEEKECSFPQYS